MGTPSRSPLRALLGFWGSLLLLFGAWSLAAPRARYVSSSPRPGATLAELPTAVSVTFSDALDQASRIEVISTLTLSPAGGTAVSDQRTLATATGPDPASPRRRTLRAVLAPGLPGGLYVVRWTAIAARGGSQRFGSFYYGVKMPVPEHIFRDMPGALRERDYQERGRRSALLGGVILLGLAALFPALARRRG